MRAVPALFMAMCATASAFSSSHALRILNPRVLPSFPSPMSSLCSRKNMKAAQCAPSLGGRARFASSTVRMPTQTASVVDPEKQLADLGITLPQVASAAANYVSDEPSLYTAAMTLGPDPICGFWELCLCCRPDPSLERRDQVQGKGDYAYCCPHYVLNQMHTHVV